MEEHNNLFTVDDQNFMTEVLQSSQPVILDFWAEWCPHCHALAPIFEKLSDTYEGKLRFAKINADENPLVSSRLGVQALPTLILVKDGKAAARIVGPHPTRLAQTIERALAQVLTPAS